MEQDFAIVLSQKETDEAIRDISLKIKSVFSKKTKYLFVFSTPHYHPLTISKTAHFTLRPQLFVGVQAPFIIFEDRIIDKGIVACCMNREEIQMKEINITRDDAQSVETSLRTLLKNFPGEKTFLLSFISHQFNPYNYIRGVELSLGKIFPLFGTGYIKNHTLYNSPIMSGTQREGSLCLLGRGVTMVPAKTKGFLPLGRPFTINRVINKNSVIMEINGQPAINIYRYYLEEKFELFKKNRLFTLYPLGIKENGTRRLVNVIDYFQDGSLVCLGEVRANTEANIMYLSPPSLFTTLNDTLSVLKQKGEGMIFIINSLIRKRILKEQAEEEIRLIKYYLGDRFKIMGLYSDYTVAPHKETQRISWEAGNLLISLWK